MMDTNINSVISVRNLTMGWPGKVLLENVSFDIYEKQIVFIPERKFLKFNAA